MQNIIRTTPAIEPTLTKINISEVAEATRMSKKQARGALRELESLGYAVLKKNVHGKDTWYLKDSRDIQAILDKSVKGGV